MIPLLCAALAVLAEAGCKPAPRLDGRHARRGLAWARAHRFAAGDTLSVLCFNSAPAEANQRQHCNLATSVAFDAEETMVEERARGRPKYRA